MVHCTTVQNVLPQNTMVVLAWYIVVPLVCNLPWSTSGVVFCIVESDDNTTCYTFACGRLVNLHSTHIIIYHTAIVDANKITNWEAAQVMKMLEI